MPNPLERVVCAGRGRADPARSPEPSAVGQRAGECAGSPRATSQWRRRQPRPRRPRRRPPSRSMAAANDDDVRWVKRVKKKNTSRHLHEQDRARFQKSRDYMVRVDDMLVCRNQRCRRRFEIPSFQTVVFI